jgi:hypothetical protein
MPGLQSVIWKYGVFFCLMLFLNLSCEKIKSFSDALILDPFHKHVVTEVNAELLKPLSSGKAHVLRPSEKVENQLWAKLVAKRLEEKGFGQADLASAEKVVHFSVEMSGPHSVEEPIYQALQNRHHGETEYEIVGYKTKTIYNAQVKIEIHEGSGYRNQNGNSMLWKAEGKAQSEVGDKNLVIPYVLESILQETGNSATEKIIAKRVK